MKTIQRIAVIAALVIVFSGALYAAFVTDFALVVGSFRSQRNAERFLDKLSKSGFETRMIRSRTARGEMTRVLVGKFATVRDALAFRDVNFKRNLYPGVWAINMLDTAALALVSQPIYQTSAAKKELKPVAPTAAKSEVTQKATPNVKKNDIKEQKSRSVTEKSSAPKVEDKSKALAKADTTKTIAIPIKTENNPDKKAIKIVRPESKASENASKVSAPPSKPAESLVKPAPASPTVAKASAEKPATPSREKVPAATPDKPNAANQPVAKQAPAKQEIKPENIQTKNVKTDKAVAPAPSAQPKPAPRETLPAKTSQNAKEAETLKSKPASALTKKNDPKLFESFTAAYQKFIKAAAESDAREISQFIHLKNGVFVYINPGGGRVTLRTDSYSNVLSIAGATIANGDKDAKQAFGDYYNKSLIAAELPSPDCATLKYKQTGLFACEAQGADCNLTQNFRASKETVNYRIPEGEIEQIRDAERTIRYAVRSTDCKTISTLYFSYIAGKWYLTLVDFTSPCLK